MAGPSQMSPCAACKFLRRKCTPDCLFAPYFPPDQPQKFANVHKIFGASNITKLLHDLPLSQREDAVNSLAYEADARVKDPVYGCVGAISVLQQQVAHLQAELAIAHAELTRIHTTTVPPLQDDHENPAVLSVAMSSRPLVSQALASYAGLKPDSMR
ncbi:Lateral organ boundaries (LOB) domain-containing protein [Klebsormidium nitens]|uniref:Lateral organ boundaries (LOB) domain-containing protein n=1 Tax=Klebsormidium nitens TaxID=105231 RepID=A0A1Y1I1U4_KLENI|nr:Lateral organ boundaries (LOB) domain-containing protein [Klebsormidium nitens]|eukprot:GAQ83409.1 Lateral organ boundaries (LOB) domain-containing protein [Klebsormidium nitens]